MPGSAQCGGQPERREVLRAEERDDLGDPVAAAAALEPGQRPPGSPYVGLVACFPLEDVDAALARAEQLGGTRVLAPVDTPVSRIAVFADPDGNRVGLVRR
ncbi:VOC family protein [Actinocatenispora sera]|uniref:VOC family protein n=1 Tax=Actinocatenispora sera TaxID=390989 RepID=UPI00340CC0FE